MPMERRIRSQALTQTNSPASTHSGRFPAVSVTICRKKLPTLSLRLSWMSTSLADEKFPLRDQQASQCLADFLTSDATYRIAREGRNTFLAIVNETPNGLAVSRVRFHFA